MTISVTETDPVAIDVEVTDAVLRLTLDDGREISAPVAWFPRLRDATANARANWRFIGRGEGVHWPELDEDISVAGILSGKVRPRTTPKAA